ncbi:hypothetical protein SLEP1_g8502 [Rubroshorea leprosula]|uniref:Uncharacterized protein n=1 Tax=Rubroshorea leprosula TaxID=152421 RepID=A0AAV5I7I7_9ROSI|nr:hypothetical protein SLEP1_g8502 [Rubroshorea leprosula]
MSSFSVFSGKSIPSNLQSDNQKAVPSTALENLMKESEDLNTRDGHSSNGEERGETQIQHSDSSLSTINSPDDSPQNGNLKHCRIESSSGHEDAMSRSLTGSTQSFIDHLAQEEFSSTAVGPHFHPFPCSSSVSIRSNSSTASSQSFAFPILQSEWNDSPVRMAKPDQKQMRKQQSWKICFLCCKF